MSKSGKKKGGGSQEFPHAKTNPIQEAFLLNPLLMFCRVPGRLGHRGT